MPERNYTLPQKEYYYAMAGASLQICYVMTMRLLNFHAATNDCHFNFGGIKQAKVKRNAIRNSPPRGFKKVITHHK